MNKTAIKNFAIWARNKLISDINYRAGLLGIAADGIHSALPQSTGQTQFYDIGTAEPYAITGEQILQRQHLVDLLRQKEKESDYKTAYKYVLEEVAYTWFNRLIAVRFMEVNDYLPSHIRVLSSESGKMEPDLVTTPFDTDLELNREEQQTILDLKNANKLDEVFRLLFIKQCNALNEILPALFEKTSDYTELLLNLSVIDQDGVIWHLVHDIPESDFNVEEGGQVEIIGWLYQYYNTEPKNEAFAKKGKITKDEIPAVTQLFTPDWIVRYLVENSLGRIYIDKRKNEGVFADGRAIEEMTWHEIEAKRIANEEYIANEMGWKYYIPEAEQEPDVVAQLSIIHKEYEKFKPEDIKVIDPCMGSGHILVYAFDVLMQIYESAGYSQRDAARNILENNIYGLDIDDRAFQMAYFAVMMKARQYNRRILSGEYRPNVYSIQESNGINRHHLKYFGKGLNEFEKNNAINQITGLLDTFVDAKEYGSILKVDLCDWDLLFRFVENVDEPDQMNIDFDGIDITQERLIHMIAQGQVLGEKYEVTVTNPPYFVVSSGCKELQNYVKKNYVNAKSDLYAVFIEKCSDLLRDNGIQAMITMHGWMFLSNYYKLREELLKTNLLNMTHLGARAFDEIGGEVVQTTAFVDRAARISNYIGKYCRATSAFSEAGKRELFFDTTRWHNIKQENIKRLPNKTWAYWVGNNLVNAFTKNTSVANLYRTMAGSSTGDNNRFLRLWFEVNNRKIGFKLDKEYSGIGYKWIPCLKGGSYRKWYGNQSYVINWDNNGEEIKYWVTHNPNDPNTKSWSRRLFNTDMYYHSGVTWSKITTGKFSSRYMEEGFIMESASCAIMPNDSDAFGMLALLNSSLAQSVIDVLNPTINVQVGDVMSIPVHKDILSSDNIRELVEEAIGICKSDWDSFETSWGFARNPLCKLQLMGSRDFKSTTIKNYYELWVQECESRYIRLKSIETKLNHIIINTYGLQDELLPNLEDNDITVNLANMQRDIKLLLSYAIGCMFGRYSLDREGVVFAGGDFEEIYWRFKGQAPLEKNNALQIGGSYAGISLASNHYTRFRDADNWEDATILSFEPDADNVIPITDEEYLEDDIVSRLCEWLRVVYGNDTLEENLDFIANALGNKGSSSREIIRNYFLNDYFKDHCQTYSITGSGKRPIYWLFDSGKQNGFKALIYLHRYNADTIGNLRIDYLHRMQRIYESEINRMQDMIDHSTSGRETAQATKRREKLIKQLKECREYDEKLAHLALSRIELNLDDGVKINYRKIQTSNDGKFYEVLSDSKNIMQKVKAR